MSFAKARVLQMAKGYTGRNKNVYRVAVPRVEKALQYAYVGRKLKKRDARAHWISAINSATREYNMKYNTLMHGLVASNILLNRKVLSELAIQEPISFYSLVKHVQALNLPVLSKIRSDIGQLPQIEAQEKIRTFTQHEPLALSLREESRLRQNLIEVNKQLENQKKRRESAKAKISKSAAPTPSPKAVPPPKESSSAPPAS